MPNWKTHIEIANRLNIKYKYTGLDYEKFIIGSILPDINNGYLYKDVSKRIDHDITHFCSNDFGSYNNFKKKYNNLMTDPLFIGYYSHLYTDNKWNNDFYTKVKDNKKYSNLNYTELREMKQSDFLLFNNNFKNGINIKNIDEIISDISNISEVDITKNDLINSINIINSQPMYESNYKFYSEDDLNRLLENTVKGISNN